MKCDKFEVWLENRDLHDVSEADKSYRHADECKKCCQLLKKDEILDQFISRTLSPTALPESMRDRVDLSLDRAVPGRSRRGFLTGIAVCLLVAVVVLTFNFDESQKFASMEEMGRFMQADYLDHGQRADIFESVSDPAVWLQENTGSKIEPPPQLVSGYTVKGARFCKVGHCQAVHMLYEKGGLLVAVFVVDEREIGFDMSQEQLYSLRIDNNNVSLYRQGGKVFALISA